MKWTKLLLVNIFVVSALWACQKGIEVEPVDKGLPVRAVRIDYPDMSPTMILTAGEEQSLRDSGITMIGVGAGRVDWSYFPWKGHAASWAPMVKRSGVDFLARDVDRYSHWAAVTAVVDVLAPLYIQTHPGAAAISWGGQSSLELVSLTQMTSGDFNKLLVDFVTEVSRRTRADSVTLVELFYYVDGFGPDDLAAFQRQSGLPDWPRLESGEININDAAIIQWRNLQLESLIKQIAEVVHQNGKTFNLEVKPTPLQIQDQDWTAYAAFLQYADRLIVFGNPIFKDSDNTAARLAVQNMNRLGSDKLLFELGLWRDDTQPIRIDSIAMTADEFRKIYNTAVQAGVSSFWFTPSYLISPENLKEITGK